ncbi:MAG: hypothetical protein R2697_04875 [Ilumatobacteraceae bacterium]
MIDERDLPRSDWIPDEWDEVGEVPAVEPLRATPEPDREVGGVACARPRDRARIVAGYVGWWYLDRVGPDGFELTDPVAFTVVETDDVESLAIRLEAEIRRRCVGVRVVRRTQGRIELTPGFYQIRKGDLPWATCSPVCAHPPTRRIGA